MDIIDNLQQPTFIEFDRICYLPYITVELFQVVISPEVRVKLVPSQGKDTKKTGTRGGTYFIQ